MLRQVTVGRRFEFWGYPKFSQIVVRIDTEVTYRATLSLQVYACVRTRSLANVKPRLSLLKIDIPPEKMGEVDI